MSDRNKQFADADRIKLIRKEMKITQDKFCRLLGIASTEQGWYSRVENGFYPMRHGMLDSAELLLSDHVAKRKAELLKEIERLNTLKNAHKPPPVVNG